jgi:Flp pilus assembly protein TadD
MRAYTVVIKQVAHAAAVHNNRGYHDYVQGDIAKARKH